MYARLLADLPKVWKFFISSQAFPGSNKWSRECTDSVQMVMLEHVRAAILSVDARASTRQPAEKIKVFLSSQALPGRNECSREFTDSAQMVILEHVRAVMLYADVCASTRRPAKKMEVFYKFSGLSSGSNECSRE